MCLELRRYVGVLLGVSMPADSRGSQSLTEEQGNQELGSLSHQGLGLTGQANLDEQKSQ